MARISPTNRTGTGGEDLLSNNFNLNLPVVGLKGRGLDLGLTLSYNSLVWIRSGNYIDFDVDDGSIAPGFRLGFATVEGPYFNDQAGQNFYLLVTPSGARVEIRYTGSGNTYESKDSAHLQLINNGTSLLVRPTDGTQMNFIPVSGTWRCNQVKDRNGNFITISYNTSAEIATITDTLGRVLTFNYDGYGNVISITQAGKAQPWATFGWGTASIGNNFPALTNLGPVSTSIAVLTQVGFADGSRYNFEYNNTYGMVSKIRYHTSDNQLRRYTTYVTPASSTDCPRLTERRDWAENWSGLNGVPAEVVTYFAHDADGACRMTAPDSTIYKEYYGSSWQSGLTTLSEVWSGGAKQKWTTTAWTQDNTGVSYLTNPRVTETNIYDAGGNRRRTTIDYGPYASYGLPNGIFEYYGDGVSLLRVTYTDYNLNQAYLDQHIIGLVSAVHVSDGQWQSKTTYEYDTTAINTQATTATMHDQNYHASFTTRGNVTSVSRWDVMDIGNSNKKHTSTFTYNAAGSVLISTDPAQHTNTISYTDSFSDGINRNTFAYATTATDAGGFQSLVQYDFTIGAVTRTQGPPPAGHSLGAIQTLAYDGAGRLLQVTTHTGAYTRYVYGPNYVQSFSTVNTIADEAYAITVFDGVGRPFGTVNNHPGSVGGYRLLNSIYDQMGRAIKQSNPTEINSSWLPAGDDAAGVVYSQQTYDWKGRPLVTTNQDGTQKYASYGGCGCAGGEVVTLTDEVGRQQKAYSDVLGRTRKSEILNWNGSIYSTTTNTFNARNQVTLLRQWAGAEGSGTYQDTTMSYDGYGRLKTKHVPEQSAGAATVYEYNNDDTIQSVTDARGASATYSYNSRHLITSINYSAPSGIPATPNVTFGYDAAGNRTSMSNSNSSVTYQYDQMSRMDWEERTFSGLSGLYRLSYGYNLAGQLTTLTQPSQFGTMLTYAHDSAGRLTNVTGSGYGTTTQFATGLQYRAWGAAKHADYGSGAQLNLTYNSRLLVTRYELSNLPPTGYPPQVSPMGTQNQFYADGRIQYAQDLQNGNFDRAYEYDHAARLHHGTSGREARGLPPVFPRDNPFHQNYSYDAWNNMTRPTVQHWSAYLPPDLPAYTNNRRADWGYNANGQVVMREQEQKLHTYDASGQTVHYWEQIYHPGSEETWFNERNTIEQTYDGDAQRIKRLETREVENAGGSNTQFDTTYYLTSSVLGGAVVTEINGLDLSRTERIYAKGEMIATHWYYSPQVQSTTWRHVNPVSGVWVNSYVGSQAMRNELDPLGGDVGTADPYVSYSGPSYSDIAPISLYEERGNPFDPGGGCATLDGLPISCSEFNMRMQGGSVATETLVTDRETPLDQRPSGAPRRIPSQQVLRTVFGEIRDFGLGLFGFALPMVGHNNEGVSWTTGAEVRHFNHAQNSGGEQLSPCLRDALRQYFPQQSAQGKSYSPIDDARFKAGIPGWVKAGVAITPGAVNPAAITLGLYDIHYDDSVNISGGTVNSLETVIEEVSHTVQFLQVWAGLKKNMMVMGKWGIDTTDYNAAKSAWQDHYAYYAVKGLSYDNEVERWAKSNVESIMTSLRQGGRGELCGFDLYRRSR